jgi:cytochrome c oxidase subunit 1
MMIVIFVSSKKSGAIASARPWEGALGLEWEVPSPAPHHTFSTPPVIRPGMLAHGDLTH